MYSSRNKPPSPPSTFNFSARHPKPRQISHLQPAGVAADFAGATCRSPTPSTVKGHSDHRKGFRYPTEVCSVCRYQNGSLEDGRREKFDWKRTDRSKTGRFTHLTRLRSLNGAFWGPGSRDSRDSRASSRLESDSSGLLSPVTLSSLSTSSLCACSPRDMICAILKEILQPGQPAYETTTLT